MNNQEYHNPTHQRIVGDIMYKVYGWMALALSITGLTAFGLSSYQPFLQVLFTNQMLWIVLFIAQIGLVLGISAGIQRMSLATGLSLFLAYSLLNGVTLTAIFLVYTYHSIALAFFVTAGMFAAMSVYGYVTRSDLSGMGSILMLGVFGLIIAMIVNIFLKSTQFEFMISIAGVFIFTLLTAFDVQRIKQMSQALITDQETMGKIALLGALTLYLDFINLFLYILRLMGQRRD